MLVEAQQGSAAGASLSALSVAQLSALNSVGANEGDFQVSRVMTECMWEMGLEVIGAVSKRGPFFLILASGAMTVAQVEDAVDGTLNIDLTPAGGDLARVNAAQTRGVILMIPFELVESFNDNDATAEAISVWHASYNGTPLGLSLEKGRTRSWVFPKNVGWRWHLFAAGNGSPSGGTVNWYSRMTGRYFDD